MIELRFFGEGGKRAFYVLASREFTEWPPYTRRIDSDGSHDMISDGSVGGISFYDEDAKLIKEEILRVEHSLNLAVDYDVAAGYFPAHLENHRAKNHEFAPVMDNELFRNSC